MSDDFIKRAIRVMNEQDEWGTAFDMIRSIEGHGLALVPVADVPTTEERAVLQTCIARAQARDLEERQYEDKQLWNVAVPALHARRAAKERG